jgi:hypothetical protein
MDLDESMNRFRLAGRELFNHFFRIYNPWENTDFAWELEKRFSGVERVLFQKLVTEPALLPDTAYGGLQTGIGVELRGADVCPIMINREISSGYWDYAINEVTRDATLLFFRFFDWDALSFRDNHYVLAHVQNWPSHQDAIGKQALIDAQYVRFVKL